MTRPHRVRILAYEGCQILDVTGPAAVFGAANESAQREVYDVGILSPAGGAVLTNCGVALQSHRIGGQPDTLLVAGRYTILDQAAIGELLPLCERRGMGLVIGGVGILHVFLAQFAIGGGMLVDHIGALGGPTFAAAAITLGLIVGTDRSVERKRRYAAMDSLAFLLEDLAQTPKDQPLVLMHHVDMARYTVAKPDTDYTKWEWDPADVAAFYAAIKGRRAAVFYGHTHFRNVFRWDGSSIQAKEGVAVFGLDQAAEYLASNRAEIRRLCRVRDLEAWTTAGGHWRISRQACDRWVLAQEARVGGAGLLVRTVQPVAPILIAYGRYAATWVGQNEIIYSGEGLQASVAVSRTPTGTLNYHNAGKVQASSEPQDMRLQRMLGHLTTLVPTNPSRVLVIACGAGVTAGAVSIDPMVKNQTIVEIEPFVPRTVAKIFGDANFHVVDNPKVHVEIDDARHYVLTTKEKFDAITSDPFDPWVKGAATLYSKEFFEIAREKLNPGGVVTVFVQLYESNLAAVKSEVSTFLSVFKNGMVFANEYQGGGYDVVLLGQKEDTPIDIDAIEARLARPEYAPMRQSLAEIGFYSATELFSTIAAHGPELAPWMADAQINYDKNLRLQYLAGMSLNHYDQGPIYADMIKYRKFPEGVFTGSPERIARIRTTANGGRP